ncbi:sterile alpha and TIR motif-containing protein 1-like isoform X2 [Pomacea canaliculata]|uniref:sterile alpha and TIR motif-containing protein 1-like isoform X2 n=1 Tax=Pomacea canaliculata TaxID=400727 RepID=UPI000D733C05|nr:sterile alpha and TIR motif-containing protein 1-like isoform X2 [Pomacea canaliculata]
MKCFTSSLSLVANVPKCITHVVILLKGKSGTVAPHHDETDAGHITISASPSISSSRNFTINGNDSKGTQHLTKFSRNRVSPATIISFPPEDQEISQETVSSEADITEVQSSHCQNLSQEKQGTDSRSTGNSPPGFYIDLNNMAEAVLDEIPNHDQNVNENLESPTSGIHRISSESTIKREVEETDDRKNDPYKVLERSQSDAYLLRNSLETEEEELVQACSQDLSTMRNVSECSRVYLDLSRAEPFERVEFTESSMGMFRSSSGRQLETIPQDEELKTGDLSYLYATRRSFSNDSSSSLEDVTGYSKVRTKEVSSGVKFVKSSKMQDMMKTTKTNLKSSIQIYSHTLKQKVRTLQMGSVPEQINALEELNVLMEQAWSMPVYGKDLAYSLCDILRTEKALDIIISNLSTTNRDLLKASARLLEQSLTTHNRKQIAECGLEAVVKMTRDRQGDVEMASCMTGILESLFKTSEETCSRVIKLGGLDVLIYWCRCNDRITLKHCAIALSNLALYGGPDNQEEMAKHRVPEWLFPLAFIDDDSTRYYACLAIAVLVSNKEIEAAVLKSGTLSLVRPFVELHDPQEFAQMDTSHQHGRSSGWLRRLVPVLTSKREEAQALAAFHLAMEAGIKAEQDRKEVLYEVGAVEPLKWLASTPNSTASRLAAQALRILGEQVPHKLSQQVPLWTTEDVAHWVSQVGFADFADSFRSCQVDGDLLLRLTEEELMESIEMGCAITRKRFLRELRDLKISADYTSCDPTKLSDWLVEVGPEFSQYTYQMIYSGVDKQTLRSLSHEHLSKDCAITNGIHRMKILSKIEELRSAASSPTAQRSDTTDGDVSSKKKPIDVFISYRRSNGSQLASLLKVHLQLRGFTVFIDIERLRAGKFDESLLESVRHASNFIIVLTPNALDRCVGDDEKKDWVHKEIVAAIEAGVNIIPLFDNFHWPPAEQLPQDMRNLSFFNGVRWIHDYQDACVDKLERFIRGEAAPSGRAATHSTSSLSGLDGLASPSGCSTQNILHTAADKKAFEGPSSCPILNSSES